MTQPVPPQGGKKRLTGFEKKEIIVQIPKALLQDAQSAPPLSGLTAPRPPSRMADQDPVARPLRNAGISSGIKVVKKIG